MRAKALNAADARQPEIVMDTDIGRLHGKWHGMRAVAEGESVDVELDVGRPRSFAEFAVDPPVGTVPGMIQGVIATTFDDGMIVLQVGSAAVQIEVEDGLPDGDLVGLRLGLAVDDLEFHPSGV